MGTWDKHGMYRVGKEQLDEERAVLFAFDSVSDEKEKSNLYDRYKLSPCRKREVVVCGKLAEQAFTIFAKEVLDLELKVNYEVYRGEKNVDGNDFSISGYNVDVKASRDTQERGINKCLETFNFPVPQDQTIKDITVEVIYDNQVRNFYIAKWIDKYTYETNATTGYFMLESGKRQPFYKLSLKYGYEINELESVANNTRRLEEYVKRLNNVRGFRK
ncbi:hypothetical protein IMSAGC020_02486 [Lachnospiraceae bacterium]|jgi:hypothetical protein|nr:hypothetical protein IMSAGC020_02486 [Lachnospiraceae bacterium]